MDIQNDKDFAALPEVAKLYQACKERDLTIAEREYLKGARDAWQAKAKATPEGFVLVPKDKVRTYFQDDDEPENYCDEGNLNGLGDCLDGDDIISVSKYDQATISKVKMFGVWDYKQTKNGAERVKFVICNTRQEAEAYVAKFLNYLGIEAQEQSYD